MDHQAINLLWFIAVEKMKNFKEFLDLFEILDDVFTDYAELLATT